MTAASCDLTDAEWALIEALIPRAKRGGNKRTVVMREVVNGLMYILTTGCQWRALPKDLPARSTVNRYFVQWTEDGTVDRIHHALYVMCREMADRDASPRSQLSTVRASRARKRGASIDLPGYDAGKKIKGKKRQIAVDTQGCCWPLCTRPPSKTAMAACF